MKGSKFLKVTGILMIIGGAIGLILGIVALVSTAGLAALVGSPFCTGGCGGVSPMGQCP